MRNICLLACLLLLAGCSSNRHLLLLDPVGPGPGTWPLPGNNGSLLVFSARTASPESGSERSRDRYSDYRVLSADGKETIETVRNDEGRLFGGPTRVALPAGQYRVLARANGYGLVMVPVVIQPNQTTVLHLEGSFWWPRNSGIFDSHPVRLPSGQIVGWPASPGQAPQGYFPGTPSGLTPGLRE